MFAQPLRQFQYTAVDRSYPGDAEVTSELLRCIGQKVASDVLSLCALTNWEEERSRSIREDRDGSQCLSLEMRLESALRASCSLILPRAAILGEEGGYERPPGMCRERNFLWLIDPLDGTTAFLQGKQTFAVAVALAEVEGNQVRPCLGIIQFPALDLLVLRSESFMVAFDTSSSSLREINSVELQRRIASVRSRSIGSFSAEKEHEVHYFGSALFDGIAVLTGSSPLAVIQGSLWDVAALLPGIGRIGELLQNTSEIQMNRSGTLRLNPPSFELTSKLILADSRHPLWSRSRPLP